jgi:hypothetical protein
MSRMRYIIDNKDTIIDLPNSSVLVELENLEKRKLEIVKEILETYTPEYYQTIFKNYILPNYKIDADTKIIIEYDYIVILRPKGKYVIYFNAFNSFEIQYTEYKYDKVDIIYKYERYKVINILNTIKSVMSILFEINKED